jgi:hypothetical protein
MELCCAKKPMLASGEGRSPAPPMPSWETQGPGALHKRATDAAATHMGFGFANALQQDNNLQFLGLESRKESSP